MRSKELKELKKLRELKEFSTILLCAAFFTLHFSLFTSCKQEDDKIEIVPARHWVEKKVAVVAPLGDAATKARLERTADWFLQNFREAQMHDTLAIDLKLVWYDELSADLTALSETLAASPSSAPLPTRVWRPLPPPAWRRRSPSSPRRPPARTSSAAMP